MQPNQFVVVNNRGVWQAAYDKNLSAANQPTAFEQARITAKHPKVRGRVIDSDSERVVFDDAA